MNSGRRQSNLGVLHQHALFAVHHVIFAISSKEKQLCIVAKELDENKAPHFQLFAGQCVAMMKTAAIAFLLAHHSRPAVFTATSL